MQLVAPNQFETPGASKSFPGSLASVNNISGAFDFTESPGTLGAGDHIYDLTFRNNGDTEGVRIFLRDDGFLLFLVGPILAAARYTGTWTPNNGSHTVFFTVDGAGVPRIWIDGVESILTLGAPTFVVVTSNTLEFTFHDTEGDPGSQDANVRNIFITSGVLPPSTVFCCP